MLKVVFVGLFCLGLSACATTPINPVGQQTKPKDHADKTIGQDQVQRPGLPTVSPPQTPLESRGEGRADSPTIAPRPNPSNSSGTVSSRYGYNESGFSRLAHWGETDPAPALNAFNITCNIWMKRDPNRWVSTRQKAYGRYRDWAPACAAAKNTPLERTAAISFFQTQFEPVIESEATTMRGLMTGYYIPMLDVRRTKDAIYSEPILRTPTSKQLQNLPRAKVSERGADVIAYGKPTDVFFMQIQGSGRIKYKDGTIERAAFDSHNNYPYVSIGGILIRRGEMTKDTASKATIIAWMNAAGPKKMRELINENPRYIYFKTEPIEAGIGPKGAMGVPLTSMGSVAVDPNFHPYGVLYWVETKLPQVGGDYIGTPTGLLLSAQDTGGAIKREARGDIFFGFGYEAGRKAGVMKHEGRWTMILPKNLAHSALAY